MLRQAYSDIPDGADGALAGSHGDICTTNGVLFSADAFGSFGSLDGRLFDDEVNFDRDWIDNARRYFTNIVGEIRSICTAAPGKS